MSTKQITNGKAFEYAITKVYNEYLRNSNIITSVKEDNAYKVAKKCYESFSLTEREKFDKSLKLL